MKKRLLFLVMAITQLSVGQTPNPTYTHSFSGTLASDSFTVGNGITLTTDRNNQENSAGNLPASHDALKLDITDNKTALMTQGTATMWFKTAGTGTSAFGSDKPLLFWSNGEYRYSEGLSLAMNSEGKIKIISFKNEGVGYAVNSDRNFPVNASGWNHFAVSWKYGNGGYVRVYLNSQLVATLTINHVLPATTLSTMYFGGFSDAYPTAIYGDIDEIKVFTRALTADQITSVYDSSRICTVTIPDDNFRYALLNHTPTIDTNRNGIIECTEAASFTGTLDVSYKSIGSLRGIEHFTGVTYINCSGNELTSLNVSNNLALTRLDCNRNQLNGLDIRNNLALNELYCGENPFTYVDAGFNTLLFSFHATGSPNLQAINLANGNNRNFVRMMVAGSPNLNCIRVDDPTYSNANWASGNFNKPSHTIYSETCTLNVIDFEATKVEAYPNPTTGIVNISEIANVTVFDIQGRIISEYKNVTSFDLSNQTAGVYFAKVIVEKSAQTIKIIKQ